MEKKWFVHINLSIARPYKYSTHQAVFTWKDISNNISQCQKKEIQLKTQTA